MYENKIEASKTVMRNDKPRIIALDQSLRELEKLGSPVDLEVIEEQSPLRRIHLEQSGESYVFGLENGRLGYGLYVSVLNRTSRYIYFDEVDVQLPWSEALFQWLEPRNLPIHNRRYSPAKPVAYYRFPGKASPEFEASDVINKTLAMDKRLPPQRPVCGWLLALGGAIPNALFERGEVEAEIVMKTVDKEEYRASIVCYVEQLKCRTLRRPVRPGLFDEHIGSRSSRWDPGSVDDSQESISLREDYATANVSLAKPVRSSAGAKG